MVKVLIKKLNSSAQLPTYKTKGASGMDLMACIEKPINLEPGKSCLIPTGLSVAFSEKYEIQISNCQFIDAYCSVIKSRCTN